MTQPPGVIDGMPGGLTGPPLGPTERHHELAELAELIGQGIHAMSHHLAQIAGDLHVIRERLDALAPVADAYRRGGPLAARVAARQQRKAGGTPE